MACSFAYLANGLGLFEGELGPCYLWTGVKAFQIEESGSGCGYPDQAVHADPALREGGDNSESNDGVLCQLCIAPSWNLPAEIIDFRVQRGVRPHSAIADRSDPLSRRK